MNIKNIKCYLEKKDCHAYKGNACACLTDTRDYVKECPFYKSRYQNNQIIAECKARCRRLGIEWRSGKDDD